MIKIVLGTGFGDEGKGQCTHALSTSDSLVIRFSGGHQCGHTAKALDGRKHIFSQFGAGTLNGASTYISEYCTLFPIAFVNEYKVLSSLQTVPLPYFVHPMTLLTTPFDLAYNRALSMINGHGTCGVGFGTCIQRNEDFVNLYINDIFNNYVFSTKMDFIKVYYENKVSELNMSSQLIYQTELDQAFENWEESLKFFKDFICVKKLHSLEQNYKDFIFEGSQGIMLDQHFGFFPHVTRSNTTSVNALNIIRENFQNKHRVNTYYVSRCYQTRHGNGPFSETPVLLQNTESESNQENDWQGNFRTAALDIALLKHSISCDNIYNSHSSKELVITCVDHLLNPEDICSEIESVLKDTVQKIQFKSSQDWSFL